jgi:hypothetical protein
MPSTTSPSLRTQDAVLVRVAASLHVESGALHAPGFHE